MIETVGLLLGVIGVVFAFETPRRRFVRLLGFNNVPANVTLVLQPNRIGDSCGGGFDAGESDPNTLAVAPKDIVDKKEHLSEIEFDEYFNSFIGHTVNWEGRVGTVSLKKGGEAVSIQMIFCDKKLRGFLDIKLKDYPNVKLFKSGDSAIVSGKIHSPDWPTFDLKDAKILKWTKKKI